MTHLIETYGLALLFLVIALESGGLPLPGEASLIAAAVLAAEGHFPIAAVIALAAAGAIVGDNAGYWVARTAGRRLLRRYDWLRMYSDRVLPPAERFFARHGSKAVFLGRFVAILRVTAAWLAGISRMPWWRFLTFNALGGICWALLVGLVSFYFGRAAANAIGRYGLIGGAAAAAAVVFVLVGLHFWRRRMLRAGEGEA